MTFSAEGGHPRTPHSRVLHEHDVQLSCNNARSKNCCHITLVSALYQHEQYSAVKELPLQHCFNLAAITLCKRILRPSA
jgi:hypothetical protein